MIVRMIFFLKGNYREYRTVQMFLRLSSSRNNDGAKPAPQDKCCGCAVYILSLTTRPKQGTIFYSFNESFKVGNQKLTKLTRGPPEFPYCEGKHKNSNVIPLTI